MPRRSWAHGLRVLPLQPGDSVMYHGRVGRLQDASQFTVGAGHGLTAEEYYLVKFGCQSELCKKGDVARYYF